jgi:hypothetical protein
MSKPQRNPSGEDQAKKKRNYKLLVDPELRRDATKKIYRFDGCVPGESPIPTPRDPRVQKTILGGIGKIWDIPVPRFKVCQVPRPLHSLSEDTISCNETGQKPPIVKLWIFSHIIVYSLSMTSSLKLRLLMPSKRRIKVLPKKWTPKKANFRE